MLNMMTRGFLPYQPPQAGGPEIMQFSPYGDSGMGIDAGMRPPSSFAPPMPSSFAPPLPSSFVPPPPPSSFQTPMFDQFNPTQPMFGQPFNQMNFSGMRGATRPGVSPLNMMLRRSRGMRPRGFGQSFGQPGGQSFGQSFGQSGGEGDFSGLNPFGQTF